MKLKAILAALAGGALIGAMAASHAWMPEPTPEEKAAATAKKEKEAAEKAQQAKLLAGAQDRAVANYQKNRAASSGTTAQPQR